MKNLPFAYKKGLLALRVIPQGRASKLSDKTLWVFCFPFSTCRKQAFSGALVKQKSRFRGILSDSFGGERGIRTPGSVVTDQRFSRPPHSTALPFLRRKDNIFLFL
jgi:hypothetical protein